ncbi:hypothetical protein, partial [Streptomyces anulatus]|uniref:hypothetical protein n=1 Tax=Streptomyces anulatus TaxID=1892 RepID=UPI003424DF21
PGGRQTIAAFLADPATGRAAAPVCDPGLAPYRIIGPGELHLTSGIYRAQRAWWTLLPFALFVVTAVAQLTTGLRRPRHRLPSVLAGLFGVVFTALTADALYGVAAENEIVLVAGVPSCLPWYGTFLWLGLAATATAVVRERRSQAQGAGKKTWISGFGMLMAGVIYAGLLVWWYVWFL